MTTRIYEILASDGNWDELNIMPVQSTLMAEYDDKQAYLSTDVADWSGIASAVLIGEWDSGTGENLVPVNPIYFDKIRPLGNDNGEATGPLDSMRFAGHSEAKYVEYDDTDPDNIVAERYPETDRPFQLKIERTFITDDGFPHIPHGWKVTMISNDPLRDITARAIGIYTEDWASYLYTTGAFLDDGTGTFFTECPVGQRTADKVDIWFKLLLGSAPEGAWVMKLSDDNTEALFWESEQP